MEYNKDNQYHFRTATLSDLPELIALREAAMMKSLKDCGRWDPERSRARLEATFDPDKTQILIIDHQAAGFYMIDEDSADLKLEHLYLHPDFQNRGLGRVMMNRIQAKADLARKDLLLWVLKNSSANHFYEKAGFYIEAEEEFDYIRRRSTTKTERISVKEITDPLEKSRICTETLAALPQWFGLPESNAEYAAAVQHLPFYTVEQDGEYAGFISIKPHTPDHCEIYVMGVMPRFHRRGVGRLLFLQGQCYAHSRGSRLLSVKTLDASRESREYAQTRQFYLAMGFTPFEVMPDLWDPQNPCLVMIKEIALTRPELT